ncbi:MAG: threonine--tRNA ligase [Proteobacteria bacterium]|nr:threonine--tRNA ligase [Pseudomonadota bacterium]MDA1354726.1 threonine--tRNA ligase [Pseudomonadota bacterium]
MPEFTLPDGSTRSFENPISGLEIAASIGPGLAKAALVVSVDGELWDLSRVIEKDAAISIVTAKDAAGLEVLRHDTAHVMAEAVKELYPDTQVTIGPAIENGFYYDFARAQPFTLDDLGAIEARMAEIVERDEEITREVWPRDRAVEYYKNAGEHYKAEIIAGIPADQDVSLYRQGNFIDLCRGPHLPSTGRIGAFKLTKVAGAYWRGNSDNEMLQRIYGTAWATEKDLTAYLHRLEEAEKRDHRRLGREMNLFHLQQEAMGMVFWHPHGWQLYRTLQTYMRQRLDDAGYVEVKTPELIDRSLWEASGHWEKFREHMFTTEAEERILALKPMNCPGHVQIFRQGIKSYRDLPLRMAEFGACHRYEPSGALHGLMRVRGFVQDDAHIFCTDDQITPETEDFCELLMSIYRDFGFDEVRVNFADRPAIRVGTDDVWDRAEGALLEAVKGTGLEVQHNPGEGAFYGPKLEFILRDAIGRDWQCGTLQVDFVLPERLDASYIGEDGERHRPVMLHRAILGSLERFLGILIEHHAGRFPLWLAPRQVVVATITADSDAYAGQTVARLKAAGLKAEVDLRNEKIGYKVREHSVAKIPVILAVGGREAENETVAMRRLGSKEQEILALDEAVDRLQKEAAGPLARAN